MPVGVQRRRVQRSEKFVTLKENHPQYGGKKGGQMTNGLKKKPQRLISYYTLILMSLHITIMASKYLKKFVSQ